jgi:hypothetical protein
MTLPLSNTNHNSCEFLRNSQLLLRQISYLDTTIYTPAKAHVHAGKAGIKAIAGVVVTPQTTTAPVLGSSASSIKFTPKSLGSSIKAPPKK